MDHTTNRQLVRVLLAHDYGLVHLGIHTLLERESDILLVGSVTDAAAAVGVAAEHRLHVLLLAHHPPTGGSVELARDVLTVRPDAHLMVLSHCPNAGGYLRALV